MNAIQQSSCEHFDQNSEEIWLESKYLNNLKLTSEFKSEIVKNIMNCNEKPKVIEIQNNLEMRPFNEQMKIKSQYLSQEIENIELEL